MEEAKARDGLGSGIPKIASSNAALISGSTDTEGNVCNVTFDGLKGSVTGIVKNGIQLLVKDEDYEPSKAGEIINQITEHTINELEKLTSDMKFIVNCTIVPKTEAGFGMHSSSDCIWDSSKDGCISIQHENNSIFCSINVFGLTFQYEQ